MFAPVLSTVLHLPAPVLSTIWLHLLSLTVCVGHPQPSGRAVAWKCQGGDAGPDGLDNAPLRAGGRGVTMTRAMTVECQSDLFLGYRFGFLAVVDCVCYR